MNLKDILDWVPPGAMLLCIWFFSRLISDFDKFKALTTARLDKLVNGFYELKDGVNEKLNSLKIESFNQHNKMEMTLNKNSIHIKSIDTHVEELVASTTNTYAQLELLRDNFGIHKEFSRKSVVLMDALIKRQRVQAADLETVRVNLTKELVLIKKKIPS